MKQAIGSSLLAGGIFASHSFYINHKRKNYQNPSGTGQILSLFLSLFSLSSDSVSLEKSVADNLESGDLIFFKRDPFYYPVSRFSLSLSSL